MSCHGGNDPGYTMENKMKKAPNVFAVRELQTWRTQIEVEDENGLIGWLPARPMGLFSLWHRIECAYLVFMGKADVVVWPGGQ